MAPRLYRVILPVQDIDAAQRFYETVLGTVGERVSPGRYRVHRRAVRRVRPTR